MTATNSDLDKMGTEALTSLDADISEFKELLANVKSKRIRTMLESNLETLVAEKEKEKFAVPVERCEEVSATPTAKTVSNELKVEEKKKRWKSIQSFAWDQDGYNGKNLYIYVTLKGVGDVKEHVSCDFTKDSLDLQVENLKGVDYRLFKKPLCHEIDAGKSKFRVKQNKVVITLRKVEGKYGYDHWADLVEKKKLQSSLNKKKDDPTAGIMDMMKQMYDEGDDQMKKTIGEAMLKSRQERLNNPDTGFEM
mmetsp:Transcript_1064/g.1392  ORF Transcript_1064/g.1392 Transcript_1064/m.1392 type:complete len:251 (+) Transcript_1064:274-1026(+)